ASDTYTIALAAQPMGVVTVTVNCDSQTTVNGGLSTLLLSFDPAQVSPAADGWNTVRTITVSAAPDVINEADIHVSTITHAVGNYGGVTAANVSVNVTDDNAPTKVRNTGVTLPRAAATALTTTMLAYTDAENPPPAALVYEVLVAPGQGSLLAGATILQAGDTFTEADIVAGTMSYDHGGGASNSDGFAFQVYDVAGNPSLLGVFPITITGFNPPDVTLSATALAYAEGDPVLLVDGSATVSDADSSDFNGGRVVVDFAAGGTASDRLTIRDQGTAPGQIGLSTNTVTYGGAAMGTWSGGVGTTPLVIDLNAVATPASTAVLINNILYANVSDAPVVGTRVVRVVVRDGTATDSIAETRDVALTAVNDAPTIAACSVLTARNLAITASVAADDPDLDPLAITLATLPGKGVVSGLTANIASAPGAIAFTYTPNAGQTGNDSFILQAVDALGVAVQRTVLVTITGSGAARPWVISDPPWAIEDGGALSYDIGISMADYAPGTAPTTVTYSLVGDLTGITASFTPGTTVAPGTPVTLNITAGAGVGPYVSVCLLVTDGSANAVGSQFLIIQVVPAGSGGG
ncbi:MAG: hypothetical protein H0X45_08520, partial [Planctomycetes bacterium]|nr:hypothetical protein [Planctomycetota bacterium]